ncbi:MAG: carboxypeptidase-like regulatory domain-containing protein [Patescibacteria group bacterium]|nr:carboxypeptidase-like regulatory domain-containing protein [Patescibacteria group bacterium]
MGKNHKLRRVKIIPIAVLLVAAGGLVFFVQKFAENQAPVVRKIGLVFDRLWPYQCVDTTKFSRDTARGWKNNPAGLERLVESQMAEIKSLGANCVSLGTPYDEEFIPFLKVWVAKARANGLAVWFRGNFSGWEEWFSYPKLASASSHLQKTSAFIAGHPDLFKDGDIFTPAPEPENGKVLNNPFASAGSKKIFLDFFSSSYNNCRQAFIEINKNVACNYFSTNGNVAKDILTSDLVKKIGGIVTVDNYVKNDRQMAEDLRELGKKFQAKTALGEFGAPVPDINGTMDETGQEQFVKGLLEVFYNQSQNIAAVNYWTLQGGTTALLRDDGSEKPVTNIIKDYFKPAMVRGKITDALGQPLAEAAVGIFGSSYYALTDRQGSFKLLLPAGTNKLAAIKAGYQEPGIQIFVSQNSLYELNLQLNPLTPGLLYRIKQLGKLFNL